MDSASADRETSNSGENPPPLPGLFFHEPSPPPPNVYTKKTILQSPIVLKIVPQFKVCVTKPLGGLASSYITEANDQTWVPPEQDSFFGDDMSEDDALLGLGTAASQDSLDMLTPAEKYENVELLVRHSSLLIDGVSYALTSAVSAAVTVPSMATAGNSEDSLLLTLLSGYQLLVRISKVPRAFSDASYTYSASADEKLAITPTSHVFKPFIVQWWKLAGGEFQQGARSTLAVHPMGLAAVTLAPDSLFRIHACENTDAGTQLQSHFNVPINGVLLHACFTHPFGAPGTDNHVVFMTFTFTNQRRLAISLYSWYVSEPISGNLEKTTLPLNATFPLPVMVIPLAENHSFLLVCPEEFIVITVNNIWSADYSFSRFPYEGSFPTAHFFSPSSNGPDPCEIDTELSEKADSAVDEVFVASESGVIYSVTVTDNKQLVYRPVIRMADPISTFTLNHSSADEGFILMFASDSGGAKSLYFPALVSPESAQAVSRPEKLPYTDAVLLKDYKNWSPILDVLMIDTPQSRTKVAESAQEFWALTGLGKRTKLTNIRQGYVVKRESRNFDDLRKAQNIHYLAGERQYLVCSLPFESRVFQYTPEIEANEEDTNNVEDPLSESGSPNLMAKDSTLCCQYLPGSKTAWQFTRYSITATNLESHRTSEFDDKAILFAQMVEDLAVLAVQRSGNVTLEVARLADVDDYLSGDDLISNKAVFAVLASVPTSDQISMVKCHYTNHQLTIVSGTFSCELEVLKLDVLTGETTRIFSTNLTQFLPSPSEEDGPIIPHDAVISPAKSSLYVGSKAGHFIEFKLDPSSTPVFSRMLSLGTTPLSLTLCKSDPNFLFASLRNLWLFNFYTSPVPSRVSFEEKTEESVSQIVELPTTEPQHLRFAFLREDGLVVGSVFCHETPILRQIAIGEAAKRVDFLDTSNIFVMLCKSKDRAMRLKFADRKSLKVLRSIEIDAKTDGERHEPIFGPSEMPLCAAIWHVSRNDRVSKKLIVGTSIDGKGGKLRILDISKVTLESTRKPTVKVVELMSVSRAEPVTAIQQIKTTIFFASGASVYSTSHSLEDKKLSSVETLTTVASDVTSLGIAGDDTLLVNTQKDSVFRFTNVGTEKAELSVSARDPVPRSLVNVCAIGDDDAAKIAAGDKLFSALRIFDHGNFTPKHCFSLSLPMIPRVYAADFRAYWSNAGSGEKQICCVSVSGQVLLLSPKNDRGEEITALSRDLAAGHSLGDTNVLAAFSERLGWPFAGKVTGKGFQSLYKPFFDYDGNSGKTIDYDVEEISKVCRAGIVM